LTSFFAGVNEIFEGLFIKFERDYEITKINFNINIDIYGP